jgi:hypothetical protein
MYGLPQASHCAQQELKAVLTADDEFVSTASDDCIYVNQGQFDNSEGVRDDYAILGAHVDDLTSVGTEKGLDKIRTLLKKKFKITEKRNPAVITGVQVERNRDQRWLKIHQSAYVLDILNKNDMADCNGSNTPMDPGMARAMMMLPTDMVDLKAVKQYQVLVGAFIWLLKTRPDFSFCVSFLSRFLKCATQAHLKFARGRPLRFLKATMNYGIVFAPGKEEWILSGASDADLAGDLITARSTLGHSLKLGEFGSVIASCNLERKICTSTGQAETYALQSLCKDTIWARGFLREVGYPMSRPTKLGQDNDGVLKQSKKTVNHTQAKHYRIAQAYIRQLAQNETIQMFRLSTEFNWTDIFTKALNAPAFLRHQSKIMGPQTPGG